MKKKRHAFFNGEWEDFELEFIESYIPLWRQNIMKVVSDLFIHRMEIEMSQAELAEKIGTTQSVITRFERMGRTPSLEFIYRVAKGLGVNIKPLSIKKNNSLDSLVVPRNHDDDQQWKIDVISIVEELKEHRIKENITQAELAERMDTTQSVIARFERMGRIPTVEFIYRVAEGLNVELEPISVLKSVPSFPLPQKHKDDQSGYALMSN